MSCTKTIYPIFGDKHKGYIKDAISSTVSVAEGAVRAGKTIDNIAAFAYMIDKGVPDRIHLVTGATVGTAKLNIGDANGYGLEHIFRGRCRWSSYRDNTALIVKSHGKEYVIVFAGGSLANSYKRIRGNSYGMWMATEINLHHKDMIKEAFNRQLAAKVRRVFWDLNPTSPESWIYTKYIDTFKDKFPGKYNYRHFTIFDNSSISKERLEEVKAQYTPGTIWYKRDILGERCIAEGLVYQFNTSDEYSITSNELSDIKGRWFVSIDYGIVNAFSAILWCISDGKAYAVDEYYFDSKKENYRRTDSEHFEAVQNLINNRYVEAVIIDPSATSFKEEIWRNSNLSVYDGDNNVIEGIRNTDQMLHSGLIKISDKCQGIISEMGLYRWDEKKGNDQVVKENDHAMDAMRYMANTILKYELY